MANNELKNLRSNYDIAIFIDIRCVCVCASVFFLALGDEMTWGRWSRRFVFHGTSVKTGYDIWMGKLWRVSFLVSKIATYTHIYSGYTHVKSSTTPLHIKLFFCAQFYAIVYVCYANFIFELVSVYICCFLLTICQVFFCVCLEKDGGNNHMIYSKWLHCNSLDALIVIGFNDGFFYFDGNCGSINIHYRLLRFIYCRYVYLLCCRLERSVNRKK